MVLINMVDKYDKLISNVFRILLITCLTILGFLGKEYYREYKQNNETMQQLLSEMRVVVERQKNNKSNISNNSISIEENKKAAKRNRELINNINIQLSQIEGRLEIIKSKIDAR